MWTKFVKSIIDHNPEQYDLVFIEANIPCSKMFINKLYNWQIYGHYYISQHKNIKPIIVNVTEYITTDNTHVRVVCMDELIELGYVAKDIYGKIKNNLIPF